MIQAGVRVFEGLRWKLTLSYVLVTTAAFITVDVGARAAEYVSFRRELEPQALARKAAQLAPELGRALEESDATDRTALHFTLSEMTWRFHSPLGDPSFWQYGFRLDPAAGEWVELAVADGTGLLARSSDRRTTGAAVGRTQLTAEEAALVTRALGGGERADSIFVSTPAGATVAAVPLTSGGRAAGVLLVRVFAPFSWSDLARKLSGDWLSGIVLGLLLTGAVGLTFGSLITSWLTRRLERIGAAADAWSRADFSATAADRSGDELGLLSQRLNQMANRLQESFAVQQKLAALEERNRLARDLHDAVKQQVFALDLQLAAASARLTEPAAARHLAEAQSLVRHVQSELHQIIQELRPQDTQLDARLAEYLGDWERHTGITAELSASPGRQAPEVQEALFRIAQEALGNVARHSGARRVCLRLVEGPLGTLTLSVEDDGRGFDPHAVTAGMGLRNLRTRAEALAGGWFKIASGPGQGTRLEAGCRGTEEAQA